MTNGATPLPGRIFYDFNVHTEKCPLCSTWITWREVYDAKKQPPKLDGPRFKQCHQCAAKEWEARTNGAK